MKATAMTVLAGSALLLGGAGDPSFVGIDVVDFTGYFRGVETPPMMVTIGTTEGMHPNKAVRSAYNESNHRTYRIYAMLSGPGTVFSAGATSQSAAWLASTSGSCFNVVSEDHYGGVFHHNFPPSGSSIVQNPAFAFDTFVTIGRHVNDSLTQGYPSDDAMGTAMGELQGDWSMVDAGWYVSDWNAPQAVATLTPQGIAEDGIYRVLLAQVTVCGREQIKGYLLVDQFQKESGYFGSLAPFPSIADLNNDNRVDVLDLLILLSQWGAAPPSAADLNCSGTVDVQDLLILLSDWGIHGPPR